MNLLQKYSLSCGLKSKRPFIYEVYFPMPFKKYIYFEPFSNENGDVYKYWKQVIELISPVLELNDIKIIHCDPIHHQNKKEISSKCINISGQLRNRNQVAYLINRSICYLGTPSFALSVASSFDKKIVCVYGNALPQNMPPAFSSKNNCVLIEPETKLKPFYTTADAFERINLIKPEKIAQSVLDVIGVNAKVNFSTIYIGKNFDNKTLEIVPEDGVQNYDFNINNPIIRMDYHFDEGVLASLLDKYNSSIIFTDEEMSKDILLKYRSSIARIVYIIKKDNKPDFVKYTNSLGIKIDLITYLPKESLQNIKINYMDFGIVRQIEKNKRPELPEKSNFYYISSRLIFGKNGQFKTKHDWKENAQDTKLQDAPKSFWEEDAENLYIYSIDNKQ